MFSWLSCEKYTESASKLEDGDIPFFEKLRFMFHHLICFNCRRFLGQMKALNFALRKLASDEKSYENINSSINHKLTLSKSKKKEIEELISKENSKL